MMVVCSSCRLKAVSCNDSLNCYEDVMAQRTTKKTTKTNGRTNSGTNGRRKTGTSGHNPASRTNYRALLEALQAEVADVHRMLDAVNAPQNCGTLNGRMVEFVRKQYRKYGDMTNPGADAQRMLRAVEAPVGADGPPWSMFSP